MAEQDYEIERMANGMTRIKVPHLAGKLAFAYPFFGPKNARSLRDEIRAVETVKLREPTLGETVSLAYTACINSYTERQFEEAKEIMKNGHFTGFTATHHDPTDQRLDRSLAYIVNFPEFNEDGTVFVDNDKLIARLQAGDNTIRTVPIKEIVDGAFNPSKFARQKYLIGLVGDEEQAEIAAKLVEAHPSQVGCIWSPHFSGKVTSLAALDSDRGGDRLVVDNYYFSKLGTGGSAVAVFDEEKGERK